MALIPQRNERNFFRLIQKGGVSHKLFNIKFDLDRNKKFRIYIQPYLKETRGLASKCIQRPGQDTLSTLSLLPNGYAVSSLAKYSHPEDGNAHISGGHVINRISNSSVPLSKVQASQIFSITITNLDAYKEARGLSTDNGENIFLEDVDLDGANKILRIGGWWVHSSLVRVSEQGDIGPAFPRAMGDSIRPSIMIAPDLSGQRPELSQHFLLMDFVFENSPVEPADYTIMAAFDEYRNDDDNFSFICLTYPLINYEQVSNLIGSIDYEPGREPPPIKEFLQ